MSKAANSPTARLLQSSRLFSLPRPLPQPALESITSTGVYRASDTATLPYPTHQAIATPSSSHHRGDWGLKRALPSKATRGTSTPYIRIQAQDTPEHITDFGSAADHTLSEAKWREMGVPMLVKPASRGRDRTAPVSVFEDEIDNTESGSGARKGVLDDGSRSAQKQRWKYTGPWIAGMQDGEFEGYVQRLGDRRKKDAKGRLVQGGRERWREFLRQQIAERRLADAKRNATDEGATETLAEREELRQSLIPTDDELPAIEKRLRDDHAVEGLSSELTALICTFLDLPAVLATDTADVDLGIQNNKLKSIINQSFSASDTAAPPSTHPSAGLSYLRTNAIMENHPIHGPQAHRSPVLSRVVRTRTSAQGAIQKAQLGVGGFVASDPVSGTYDPNGGRVMGSRLAANQNAMGGYEPDKMSNQLDVDLPGGNKMWVHPLSASVDERGRIKMELMRGDREAVAVKTGNVQHIHEARAASTRGRMPSAGFGAGALLDQRARRSANYGTSLPDLKRREYAPPSQRGERAQADYDTALSGQEQRAPPRRGEVKGFGESVSKQIQDVLEGRGQRERR